MSISVRAILSCGTAWHGLAISGLLAAVAVPAHAQESQDSTQAPVSADPLVSTPTGTTEPNAAQDDNIVVTGTRIARPDLTSSSPVLVVGQDAFQNRNFTNFADLATQLPQFSASFGSSRTQSTFSGAATSGLNTVNLRNLGSGRTLTLINGRRVPGGTTTSTAVDFNSIPTANIERLDVLTGGAASIYGADAVAGVINIITKQIDGFEAGASYGISERGDNENPNGYLMFGKRLANGGAINLTAQIDFQGRVQCSSRELCAEDFFWAPPSSPIRGPAAYSAVGNNGTFFLTAGNGLGAIGATRIGNSTSYTDANGSLIPFSVTRDGFNRNGVRDIAIPTRRILFAASAESPIVDGVNAFMEFNYGQSHIRAAFEGHPFQSSAAGSLFGGGPGVPGLQASIPVQITSTVGGVTSTIANPIIPTAIYNAALARNMTQIQWQQRFSAFDGRGAVNRRDTIRAVAGLKGDFDVGIGSDWRYEVSYVYGSTRLDSQTRGLVSTRQLYNGLRTEQVNGTLRCADAGARATGCVPVNPFLPYTDAQRNALVVSAGQSGESVLHDANAFVSGSLFRLPGGDLAFSVGGEYRTFSGNLDYDSAINNAEVTGNQIGDVSFVKIRTKEVYGEVSAPILGDMTLIHKLTLDGSFRYSDPNFGGSYQTWRYGGSYEPVPGIVLRVNRARAVRTPVPGELSGVGQTFGTVTDPCTAATRNVNATRAANCAADGVPANYAPPINVQQSVGGFVGGNPNLAPERATTLTYGVAFAPNFAPGLSITVDRFDIKLDNVINTVGRQTKANQCYDTTARLFCGDLTRGTNPNVPGANYVLTGVNDQLVNIAAFRLKGIDFTAAYNARIFGGRGSFNVIGTLYDRAEQVALPGQPVIDLLGFAGGSTSDQGFIKFTGNATAAWTSEDGVGFSYNMRYIGKAQNSPFANPTINIGDRFYHNARFSFNVEENAQFFFGVNNIADSKPPLFPSSTAGTQALDTVPAYYDVFGRSFYSGIRLTF